MIVKIIYTFFLGLLIAFFVGFGIDAFYQGPQEPKYPMELESITGDKQLNDEQRVLEREYRQEQNKYQESLKPYNKNVSIISLVAAILILVASLTFLEKIKMIADGILLGGVFTLAYSIIRGLMSESSQFRFVIVTIGLMIALALGYVKFIRPKEKQPNN